VCTCTRVPQPFFLNNITGEVFYGKRKYNPSGKVDGEYNGMGLTDKTRINIARARKAQFLAEREEKQRAEMKRRGLL